MSQNLNITCERCNDSNYKEWAIEPICGSLSCNYLEEGHMACTSCLVFVDCALCNGGCCEFCAEYHCNKCNVNALMTFDTCRSCRNKIEQIEFRCGHISCNTHVLAAKRIRVEDENYNYPDVCFQCYQKNARIIFDINSTNDIDLSNDLADGISYEEEEDLNSEEYYDEDPILLKQDFDLMQSALCQIQTEELRSHIQVWLESHSDCSYQFTNSKNKKRKYNSNEIILLD